jgi:hypothetical protein
MRISRQHQRPGTKLRGSPLVFSVIFCIAYVAAFFGELPLMRYYPVPQEWAWGPTDDVVRSGPMMAWYGLVASAALVAGLGAFILREQWIAGAFRNWLWVWPCAALAACIVLLRAFFL